MTEDLQTKLDAQRSKWEQDGKIVYHKESLSGGCHVTLYEYQSNGRPFYHVYRYFFVGDECEVSVDIQTRKERDAWLKVLECFA